MAHSSITDVRRIVRYAGEILCKHVSSAAANVDVKAALLMSKNKVDVTQSPEGRKMLVGEWYKFSDPLLTQARDRAEILYGAYNRTRAWQQEARQQILENLLGSVGQGASIRPPFHCDYGFNIYLGNGVDINFGCVILDCGKVSIGEKTLIGPDVQIYTVEHPDVSLDRAKGVEKTRPINIGKNVWISGGVIILPGVTIGDNAIIGAGSVVTKNIEANILAMGVPCRPVKKIK